MLKLRTLAPLALSLMLSACWGSSGPLMPASALKPVPISGTWAQLGTDGKPSAVSVYRVTVQGKVAQLDKPVTASDGTKGWDKSYALSFDALGRNMYLVQAVSPSSSSPNYVVMQIVPRSRELQLINPACTEAQAKEWGADRSGGDCNWPDYATLRKAALDVAQAALEKPAPGLEVSSIEEYVRQD